MKKHSSLIYMLFLKFVKYNLIKDMASQQGIVASYLEIAKNLLFSAVDIGKTSFATGYDLVKAVPSQIYGIVALFVTAISFFIWFNRRWVEAQPNEWLLLIKNGKLARAGVGLKVWKSPLDTTVTFPSRVERVYFSANNVTIQMQGIIIQGFAFWTVFRDQDGPFRCYKYIQGCDANDSVKALCQAVLRNLIANSTIEEVMKNRNHLRVNMLKQLKDQFKGWGIWLQSVEITDVRISSQRLFKDLQAEFRQQTRLKAQLIELHGNEQMQQTRQQSDFKMFEKNETAETRRQQTTYEQQLKRKNQEQKYLSGKLALEKEKMIRDKNLQLDRVKNEQQKEIQKLKNAQKIQQEQQQFALDAQKRSIDLDRSYDEKLMRKYKIDAKEKIYQTLTVKDVKINQYSSDGSLTGVFPGLTEK